jgi:hypothetical protein
VPPLPAVHQIAGRRVLAGSVGERARCRIAPGNTRRHESAGSTGADCRAAAVHEGGNFYRMGSVARETSKSARMWARCGSMTALAAVLALTGCGHTVTGHAISASSNGASPSSAPATVKPDPGNYPTTPRPPLGTATTAFDGKLIDAQRMAGFVIGPWEVDPSLTADYGVGPLVLKSAAAIWDVIDPPLVTAANNHGFVNGFRSARQVQDKTVLINNVLRFPDPASATAAAAEIHQVELAEPVTDGTRDVVSIPGHPEALASNHPLAAYGSLVGWKAQVFSLAPHGSYVLMQSALSNDGLDAALALVAKTLELQAPLIDQFAATAPADFPTLPKDPSGQLARTLPVAEKDATVMRPATYDGRGELHFQTDPVASGRLFDETGIDVVTAGLTTVYRAADAASAAKVVDAFAAEVGRQASGPSAPVPGVPGSRCLTISSGGSYCVGVVDRYAFEVQSAQAPAAAQMVAAQYLMLTAT